MNIALEEAKKLQERIEALEKEESPLEKEYNSLEKLCSSLYESLRRVQSNVQTEKNQRANEINVLKTGRNALLKQAREA